MLHTFRIVTSLVAAAFLTTAAGAATWEIDPAHTSVQFAVRHLMISNVRGEFTKLTGKVEVDEAAPAAARIEATIDAASIDTRNRKRDDHLRSPDFLNVEKFPTIEFRSTKIEKVADASWKVTGNLTLHGVTREVGLDLQGPTQQVKDTRGLHVGAQATTTINRKDFGINWNESLDGGGVLIGEEVSITIDVEVIRKPTPALP
jgi:polyisoprenoid-binding protein YceI